MGKTRVRINFDFPSYNVPNHPLNGTTVPVHNFPCMLTIVLRLA